MNARRLFAGGLAAAALALAFFGGSEFARHERGGRAEASVDAGASSDAAQPNTQTATNTSPTPASDVPATTPPTASATPWPALPSATVAVADVFDELAERARRGDAAAACRLAGDLQRCAKTLAQRGLAADLQDQAARYDQTPQGMVDFIADIERRQESVGERCEGLQPAQLAQAFDFQRQAALARPELRVWFALNPALERRDFVNELERWSEYRRLALPWLEAAAREGDAAALIALARVHGDLRRNSPPYPPFRLDDPVRALAYNDALLQLGVDLRGIQIGADTARGRLDAQGQARAADLVSSLLDPLAAPLDKTAIQAAMNRTFEPVTSAAECAHNR